MAGHRRALILLVGVLGSATGATRAARPDRAAPARAERVRPNDNRRAAGVRRGARLSLRLVARVGMWYPDGDAAPGTPVQAFAEEGRAPSVPGPMIRVRAGTEVSVHVRNEVPGTTLALHGLFTRGALPSKGAEMQLAAGASDSVVFRLDVPGTYYYWGTTTGRALEERVGADAQLTGAIIVDPAAGPVANDRVMVMGLWTDTSGKNFVVRKRMLAVINGLSWPNTERLDYAVGDSVHWRLVNATADMHPMHLHGFYFAVDSRGDELADTTYAPAARDRVVTSLMRPGTTMSMTWQPERAGNWLFHCHLNAHFSHRGSLGMPPASRALATHGAMNHALGGMSGLVMGVTVRPTRGYVTARELPDRDRRAMRLVVRPRPRDSISAPSFEFSLQGARDTSLAAWRGRSAPALVLTRGEPVAITVVNTLAEPTAVHWHGIELESFYDGVAGFSGTARRLTPVIAPGDSFVARFTPPRAGTFIYHTHVDEERQQPAGLAGAIIVLERGERYDAATDVAIIATAPREQPDSGVIPKNVLLNGNTSAEPLELRAGVRYRLRLINMTTRHPGLRFQLAEGGTPVRWRRLAKDGATLPEARQVEGIARQPVSIGETADVELILPHAGELLLMAQLSDGSVVGMLPIHVRAPGAGGR